MDEINSWTPHMQQHSLYWTALRDRMEGCDFAIIHIGVSGVSQSCTPRLGPDHCIVPEYLEATATNESVVSHRPRASGTNVNCVQGVSLVFPSPYCPHEGPHLSPGHGMLQRLALADTNPGPGMTSHWMPRLHIWPYLLCLRNDEQMSKCLLHLHSIFIL